MKNLRINKESVKKLISAVLITTSLSNLTGCSLNNNEVETNADNESLQQIIVDNKVVKVSDLKLKDTETGKIIENIDAIVVGNKLDREFELIDIIFNSSVESILIDDEIVPVSRLKLVNSKTNQEIDAIDYALVGDELIPMNEYINANTNSGNQYSYNGSSLFVDADYEELTTEKFNELVASIVKKYSEAGLTVSEENIRKYVMIANIDKLSQDNQELKAEIIGEQDIDEVFADADLVVGAVLMYNYNVFYETGKTDGFINPSEAIFDKTEKDKVAKIEDRVKEIGLSVEDNKKMNELAHTLLLELTDPKSELSYLEAGAGYLTQWIIIEPIRGLFGMDLYGNSRLDATNEDLIKQHVTYAGDEEEYVNNSLANAYTKNVLALLRDCPSYTRTK